MEAECEIHAHRELTGNIIGWQVSCLGCTEAAVQTVERALLACILAFRACKGGATRVLFWIAEEHVLLAVLMNDVG